MSKQFRDDVIFRIRTAPPSSPLLVSRIPGSPLYNVAFANTVRSKRLVERGDPDIIGVFDRNSDWSQV